MADPRIMLKDLATKSAFVYNDLIDITVVKINSPADFLAHEVRGPTPSEEGHLFHELSDRLNAHFNNDQMIIQEFQPLLGQIYVGKRPKDKRWYRVKVMSRLERRSGPTANCFLLDNGVTEAIPIKWLRVIPENFKHSHVPYQVKRCCLHGVKPLTLKIGILADLTASNEECNTWDCSAAEFMKKLVQDSGVVKARIKGEDQNGTVLVHLFVNTPTGTVCLNDELVREKYGTKATPVDTSDSESSCSDSTSISTSSQESQPPKSSKKSIEDILARKRKSGTQRSGKVRQDNLFSKDLHAELIAEMGLGSEKGETTPITSTPVSGDDSQSLIKEDVHVSDIVTENPDNEPRIKDAAVHVNCTDSDTSDISDSTQEGTSPSQKIVLYSGTANSALRLGMVNSQLNVMDYFKQTIPPSLIQSYMDKTETDMSKSAEHIFSSFVQSRCRPMGMCNGDVPRDTDTPRVPVNGDNVVDALSGSQKSRMMEKLRERLAMTPSGSNVMSKTSYSEMPDHQAEREVAPDRDKNMVDLNLACGQNKSAMEPQISSMRDLDRVRCNGARTSLPIMSLYQIRIPNPHDIRNTSGGSDSNSMQSNIDLGDRTASTCSPPGVAESSLVTSLTETTGDRTGRPPADVTDTSLVTSLTKTTGDKDSDSDVSQDSYSDSIFDYILSKDPATVPSKARRPKVAHHVSQQVAEVTRPVANKKVNVSSKVSFSDEEVLNPRSGTGRAHSEAPADMTTSVNHPLKPILKKSDSPVGKTPMFKESIDRCFSDRSQSDMDTDLSGTLNSSRSPPRKAIVKPSEPPVNRLIPPEDDSDSSLSLYRLGDWEDDAAQKKSKLGSKILGQKLLAKLSPGYQNKARGLVPADAEGPARFGSSFRPPDGVIVHGEPAPQPIDNLEDVHLTESIKQTLRDIGFSTPKLIQAYSWRPILRGRDVVGVAPADSGLTLAYIPPLMTQLLERCNYSDAPIGNGALAVIICPTWKRAQLVHSHCEKILSGRRGVRLMTIFGGGSEENYYVPLINGCEVLIASPHCLMRMLEKKYTDLGRLCHLVIDEAESVIENFTDQVKEFMKQFTAVIKNRVSRSLPRQILVYCSQWTHGLQSFLESFMLEPLTIITSQFEAAVYGGVKQVPHMVRKNQRSQKLLGLLDSLVVGEAKIAVFTMCPAEALHIYQMLKTHSRYVLQAVPDMDQTQLDLVKTEWLRPHQSVSRPVLVCTDACVFDLGITDANIVIHYGMPDSKTKFGNRLSCSSGYYRKVDDPKKSSSEKRTIPVSHMFVTEDCGPVVRSLVDMLQRTGSRVPSHLRRMMEGMLQGTEDESVQSLCYYMKAFGECKRRNQCTRRHLIKPKLDMCELLTATDRVPSCGEVKVLVTYVVNASRFYVRLLEHRPLAGGHSDLHHLGVELEKAVQAWYNIPPNRFPHGAVQYGDMCCVLDEDERHYRVQVISEGNIATYVTARDKRIKIFYIDKGKMDHVMASVLLHLPQHFKNIPFQAVEAYLCRISPVDSDTDWVPRANTFMVDLVNDIELWGKIVLSLGRTVWLDPLVERVYHKSIRVMTTNVQIRTSLLRNGFAVDNPNHLKLLYAACKGRMELPAYSRSSTLEGVPEMETLSETVDYSKVYVSAVETPELFFVQRKEMEARLEDMMEKLNNEIDKIRCLLMDENIKVGTVCLARFFTDNRWYRAQIVSMKPTDENVEVFYVDYGEKDAVRKTSLKDIPEEYLVLPFQAIECCMSHLSPLVDSWHKEDGDALWDMTHHYNGDRRLLQAQITRKITAEYAGAHKYFLNLFYSNGQEEVNLGTELVWAKHAYGDPDHVKPLFVEPNSMNGVVRKRYDNTRHRIPDLCGAIYRAKDQQMAAMMTTKVKQILDSAVKRNETNTEMYEEAISAALNVVWFSQHEHVVKALLPTVTQILKLNDELVSEALDGGLARHLCSEICRSKSTEVRLTCLHTVLSLIRTKLKSCFGEGEQMEALVTVAGEANDLQIQRLALQVIASICTDCQSGVESFIVHQRGVDVLYELMKSHQSDMNFMETTCHLLSQLANYHSEEHPCPLKKEGLLHLVVEVIEKNTDNSDLIGWAILMMYRLSERSRKNKTMLLEAGFVPVLKALPERFPSLVPEVMQQCQHLLTSLDVKAPREHLDAGMAMVTHGKLPSELRRSTTTSSVPQVGWCQNSFVVMLSVRVRGVQDKEITFKENSVQFRAIVEKLYAFEFELFDKIIPSKCREKVKCTEVLITMRKEQKGRWKRLLQAKEKPSYLSIDFERFQDSSSESDLSDEPEETPFIFKKTTKGKPLPRRSKRERKERASLLEGGHDDSWSTDDSVEDAVDKNSDEYDFFDV